MPRLGCAPTGRWTRQEDTLFLALAEQRLHRAPERGKTKMASEQYSKRIRTKLTNSEWRDIATIIKTRTANQCMNRWRYLLRNPHSALQHGGKDLLCKVWKQLAKEDRLERKMVAAIRREGLAEGVVPSGMLESYISSEEEINRVDQDSDADNDQSSGEPLSIHGGSDSEDEQDSRGDSSVPTSLSSDRNSRNTLGRLDKLPLRAPSTAKRTVESERSTPTGPTGVGGRKLASPVDCSLLADERTAHSSYDSGQSTSRTPLRFFHQQTDGAAASSTPAQRIHPGTPSLEGSKRRLAIENHCFNHSMRFSTQSRSLEQQTSVQDCSISKNPATFCHSWSTASSAGHSAVPGLVNQTFDPTENIKRFIVELRRQEGLS